MAALSIIKHFLWIMLFFNFSAVSIAQQWSPVGSGLNGGVHGFAVYDGKLLMGGSFTNGGGGGPGGPGPGGGRITAWDSLAFSTAVPDNFGLLVRDLHVWNGDLIVVGDFWNQGQPCTGCNGVARWDGSAWQPLGTGVNNDVLAITEYNGDLIIAGDFEACDGDTTIKRIARWNGTKWYGFDVDTFLSNDVRAAAVYDEKLYVGGDFNNASGKGSADGIARWDENDALWKGVAKPGGIDSTVRALYVDDGKLYVGGHFRQIIGDSSMSGIACWDGKNWTSLGIGVNNYVRAIHKYNGELYVGGEFTMAGGKPANLIARWDGVEWKPCGDGLDSGYVRAMQVYKGELYVGGSFKKYDDNKTDSPYIAKWYSPPAPLVINTISSVNPTCFSSCEGMAAVSVSGGTKGYTYLWDDPAAQTTAVATGLCAGVYTVTVKDAVGQSTLQSVTITQPPKIEVELNETSNYNGFGVSCPGANDGELTAKATGGTGKYSYRWDNIFWIYSPIATGLPAGIYSVTVTDSTGCSGTASQSLSGPATCTELIEGNELFIPTGFSPNGDGINDNWFIEYPPEVPVIVEVFNRWGNLIFRSTSQNGNVKPWNGTYAGHAVTSGVYFYVVNVNEQIYKGSLTIAK